MTAQGLGIIPNNSNQLLEHLADSYLIRKDASRLVGRRLIFICGLA